MATQENKSIMKALSVLDVLLRNFAHGFSPSELATETGLSPSDITRYINSLEKSGFAERIPHTGRLRPSHRLAKHAVLIMNSIDSAENQLRESKTRIFS